MDLRQLCLVSTSILVFGCGGDADPVCEGAACSAERWFSDLTCELPRLTHTEVEWGLVLHHHDNWQVTSPAVQGVVGRVDLRRDDGSAWIYVDRRQHEDLVSLNAEMSALLEAPEKIATVADELALVEELEIDGRRAVRWTYVTEQYYAGDRAGAAYCPEPDCVGYDYVEPDPVKMRTIGLAIADGLSLIKHQSTLSLEVEDTVLCEVESQMLSTTFGGTFACGSETCISGSEYCSAFYPGTPEGQPTYGCGAFEEGCNDCSCFSDLGGCSCSDRGGNIMYECAAP